MCHFQLTRANWQKEHLSPHDVPSGTLEKVCTDLLQHKSHYCLIVAATLLISPLVKKLSKQTAAHVVSLQNTIFLEHGIPAYVPPGQGSQFTSTEFIDFARCYQFDIIHSTPRFPQSKGFAEAMVMIVKETMSKAEQSAEDLHFAMLSLQSHTKKSREAQSS